jgi:hypothetical protein
MQTKVKQISLTWDNNTLMAKSSEPSQERTIPEQITEELLLSYIPDALTNDALCEKLFHGLALQPQCAKACMGIIEEKIKNGEKTPLAACALNCLAQIHEDYSHLIPALLTYACKAYKYCTAAEICLHYLEKHHTVKFNEYATPIIKEFINSEKRKQRSTAMRFVPIITQAQTEGMFSIIDIANRYRNEVFEIMISRFSGYNATFQASFFCDTLLLAKEDSFFAEHLHRLLVEYEIRREHVQDLVTVINNSKHIPLIQRSLEKIPKDEAIFRSFVDGIHETAIDLMYTNSYSNKVFNIVNTVLLTNPKWFEGHADYLVTLTYPELKFNATDNVLFSIIGTLLSNFDVNIGGTTVINDLVNFVTTGNMPARKTLHAIVNSPYKSLLQQAHLIKLTKYFCGQFRKMELFNSMLYVYPGFYYNQIEYLLPLFGNLEATLATKCFLYRAGNVLKEKDWLKILTIIGKISHVGIDNRIEKDRITRCLCYLFAGFISTEQLVYFVKKNYTYKSVTSALRDVGKALMKRDDNTDTSMIIQIALQMGRSPDIQVLMYNELKSERFTDVTIKRES